MSQHRQLSAIVFTDIEGYSAFMQEDESKALVMRTRHREVLESKHQEFNGRIIQYYGDGSLSIFQSAVEAVACALAMQLEFRQEPQVPVRMGLHIGDIVVDEQEQVYGDGVNLASRIESLGKPGSVLLSDRVNDEINNHPLLKTVSVGHYQLKNIKRRVEVFALDHEGLVKPAPFSLDGKLEPKKIPPSKRGKKAAGRSIAVLPFVNMSNDPEQEYFGEGIAEEILTSLSSLKDLKVAGRTSSFQFNGKNADVRQIGGALGVSTVLEGSIRKQGNHVRVTAQLVNVEDGFHLWSEKYDCDMDNIFAVQDEIAMAITEKLKGTLLENEKRKIVNGRTHNSTAYELYLKGRYALNSRGASILMAIGYFEKSIELDPGFCLAHAGYADANFIAAFYGLLPSKDVVEKARAAAEVAIKLDPTRCEPYCSLGCYYACFAWNWEEAEKNFGKAMEKNPQYAQSYGWYGLMYLAWVKGDFVRAEEQARIAIRLEPLSAIAYNNYGSILHTAGKFESALEAFRTSAEIDNNIFTTHMYRGWCHLFLRQYGKAMAAFELSMKISNRHHFAQNALIIAYCMVWRFNEANALMKELKDRSVSEYIGAAVTGLSEAYLDHLDEAFTYFEKAIIEKDPMLLTLKYEHWVPEQLKEDPRFQALLHRIGFPGS